MPPTDDAPPAGGAESAVPSSEPPTRGQPPWLRYLTHLVALGWGSAELALWGARARSLSFIGLILLADYGPRAVRRLTDVLRATA